MKTRIVMLCGLLLATVVHTARAGQSCTIHQDDPKLLAVLAQPVPTTNVIPDSWAEVGDRYISLQAHWSNAALQIVDPTDGSLTYAPPRMRHTHFEVPKQILYCEINGPIRFPFRMIAFQTDGYVDVRKGVGLYGENVVNVEWDDPGVASAGRFYGDPTDMGLVIKTGHMTIDPTKPTGWSAKYNAPPHGWYAEQIYVRTYYPDKTALDLKAFLPLYSMINPSVSPTIPKDPRYIDATDPWRGLQVFSTPMYGPTLAQENAWGANSVRFDLDMLPTFGTLVAPYAPRPVASSTYGGGVFEPGGLTMDFRIGENLHMGIAGTFLAQKALAKCCGDFLKVTFDPARGTGDLKFTFNWNQTGGPCQCNTSGAPKFPTRRTVSALITVGVNVDPTQAPPPPPPPDPEPPPSDPAPPPPPPVPHS